MTKLEKNTFLKNKISRAVKKTALLSVLLCYILSTVIHADYREEYDGDNISEFRLYGRTSVDGTDSWRVLPLTENNGEYSTSYQTYSQYRQRLQFSFNEQKPINNIYLTYTIVLNPDVYSSGNVTFSDNIEQMAYVVQSTQGGASTAWFPDGTMSCEKSVKNNEITYVMKYNGDVKVMRSIRAFTSINTLSTSYTIKNIQLVINDKQYKVVSALDEVNQSLEDYASQMTVPIPDVNDVVDIIDGNIPQIDTSYKDAILLFTSHYIIIEILVIVIALALLSYIVYGRKT